VNFLRRLALQEEKLDDSSRLDVVEIERVAWHAFELVSFLVRLRTYQHPGISGMILTGNTGRNPDSAPNCTGSVGGNRIRTAA